MSGPRCLDCRHCQRRWTLRTNRFFCERPRAQIPDSVLGGKPYTRVCEAERRASLAERIAAWFNGERDGFCGPGGRFFEARETDV